MTPAAAAQMRADTDAVLARVSAGLRKYEARYHEKQAMRSKDEA